MRRLRVLVLCCTGCDADYWGLGFQDFYGAPLTYDDSDADQRVEVAALALASDRDPEANLAGMEALLAELMEAQPDTRVAVFGETALGWFYDPDDPEGYQRSVAQPIPGEATDRLAQAAAAWGLWLAFGMAEDDGGTLHNAQVLLDPSGKIAAVHRKVRLTDWDVESGYVAGAGATVVDLDGITTGLLVCSDAESQSQIEDLADAGVELVLHSWASAAAFGSEIDPAARLLGAWMVSGNRWGEEADAIYEGAVFVSDPSGTHRAFGEGAEQFVHTTAGIVR